MYPCTLKNLTPEDQIEIKKTPKIRDFETYQQKKTKQNLRLRGAKITPKRDFKTHWKRFQDF